jgi:acyl-CoA thioesterase-1
VAVLMAAVTLSGVAVPSMGHARTLMVLGDSLSAGYGIDQQSGWVSLLQQRLDRQQAGIRVVNESISGDTTAGGLARLPAALQRHAPAIVIIELGGNDGLRGLPLTDMRSHLERMIDLCQAGKASVLLVGMKIPPNLGRRYTERFEAVFVDVAELRKIARVPFLLGSVAGEDGNMQADGIHPVAAAQPTMLDNVWPHLAPLLGKKTP